MEASHTSQWSPLPAEQAPCFLRVPLHEPAQRPARALDLRFSDGRH